MSLRSSLLRWRATWLLLGLFGWQWWLLAVAAAPSWDGAFYYAYARSIIFDGDLHLSNDLQLAYPTAGEQFAHKRLDQDLTVTGYVNNPFAPGAALLWLPWLAGLRLLAFLTGQSQLTGYEWPFTLGAATLSALAGLAAFGLAQRLARKVTTPDAALLATLTLMLTTPLLHYQFREPFYSHAAAALATTGIVIYWRRTTSQDDLSAWSGFWLGAVIGLAALVRWQHVLYLALPGLTLIGDGIALPSGRRRAALPRFARYAVCLGLGVAALLSIQFALWRLFYGRWLVLPQGESFLDWRAPWLWPALTSTFHGLLTWMPVTLPAVIGLGRLTRRQARLAWPLLGLLALELFLNGSTRDWFAGGGYGPRRFSSELAIWLLGYAAFVEWARRRWLTVTLSLGLVWQQWVLLRYGIAQQMGGFVVSMAPVFRWQDMTWGAYFRQIGEYAWRGVGQARDFWVLPDSPLAHWLAGTFPWSWVGLMVGLLLLGYGAWRGFGRIPATPRWLLISLLLISLLALNFWILRQTPPHP